MGGKEAKERRRLQRQAAQEQNPDGKGYGSTEQQRTEENLGKDISNKRRNGGLQQKGNRLSKRKNTGDDSSKKKAKKPKHLKRKLEELSEAAEQDPERAALLEKLKKEMKAFEQEKAKRSFVFEKKIQAAAGEVFDKVSFVSSCFVCTSLRWPWQMLELLTKSAYCCSFIEIGHFS